MLVHRPFETYLIFQQWDCGNRFTIVIAKFNQVSRGWTAKNFQNSANLSDVQPVFWNVFKQLYRIKIVKHFFPLEHGLL